MEQRKVKRWIYCFCMAIFPVLLKGQTDSFDEKNLLTRTMTYGIGYANVYDTYLSPQEYKGVELRLAWESMRTAGNNLSVQSFVQANASYTENYAENNNTFSGLVNWNYLLYYNLPLSENFKILAGGGSDLNGGFVYNLHNSNNPASVRAYLNLAASTIMLWDIRIKNKPFTLRYQANVPLIGVFFSPNYGQSYHEIFTLGNYDGVFNFTSLDKQPSVRQMFGVDAPIGNVKLRLTYMWDMQQSKVNGIRTHTYGHVFMFGFVKEFYRIRRKNK